MPRTPTTLTRLLWIVLALGLAIPDADASEGRYRLTFSGARRRVLHVEALIQDPGEQLSMSPAGAHHLEERWMRWIEGLSARDSRGREVRLAERGPGRWRILGPPPEELHLVWQVNLDHDLEPWPLGWDESTYVKDDCIYLATDAVMIAPTNLERAGVSFDLPPGWKVSSGWREVTGDSWGFEVDSFEELCHSSLLVGEHVELRQDVAGSEWVVAVGRELEGELGLIADALELALEEAVALFGSFPGERFLLVANRADYTGGSAHHGAVSMVFGDRPKEGDAVWVSVLVHEMVHLWNGITIRRADHRCEWFVEGVTDYLSVMIVARAGLADPEEVLARVAESYRMYELEAGRRSLADAGEDKRGHYELIYGGGFWMGLLLDVELRAASRGKRSIADLMQRLFEEYGDSQKAWQLTDLQRLTTDVAGRSLAKFYQRHVHGEQRIPVEAYLARLGLEVDVKGRGRRQRVTVERRRDTTARQTELTRMIFGDL